MTFLRYAVYNNNKLGPYFDPTYTRTGWMLLVAWSMPDGFTLGAEPSKLDASLVGKHIYMRWKDYGWQLGKVYEQITSANPRLLKKYNYRVVWADTAKGPTSLRVENYAHGSDAALDSWVVLERKEGGAGGAE